MLRTHSCIYKGFLQSGCSCSIRKNAVIVPENHDLTIIISQHLTNTICGSAEDNYPSLFVAGVGTACGKATPMSFAIVKPCLSVIDLLLFSPNFHIFGGSYLASRFLQHQLLSGAPEVVEVVDGDGGGLPGPDLPVPAEHVPFPIARLVQR